MRKVRPTRPILFHEDTRPDIRHLTRQEVLDRHPHGESLYVGGTKTDWTAYRREYHLIVLGDKIFWKQTVCVNCTFKNGKFYGSIIPLRDIILKAFRLDWLANTYWAVSLIGSNKDLWKAVITGKVTNPEDLCKWYSRKYFKGAYSYKSIKGYYCHCSSITLWDIYYYTTNPDLTMQYILESEVDSVREDIPHNYSWRQVLHDAIKMAKYFNEKINPKWSLNRLREEHQKQIERKHLAEIENISDKPIVPACKIQGLSLILDERTCYLEGMKMRNCVHSCYWNKILRGEYLIARGTVAGEYIDLGILVSASGKDIGVDQVYTIYNGNPSDTIRQWCYDWVENNQGELMELAAIIKSNTGVKKDKRYIEEIPW